MLFVASPARLFIVRIASANDESLAAGGVGTARLTWLQLAAAWNLTTVAKSIGGARPTRRPPGSRVVELYSNSASREGAKQKATERVAFLFGVPSEIRTRVTAVKGREYLSNNK